ncbi:MAG: N-acetylneuraminate synthase family protein [Firmicutes bacterium]|nr:N-acetylneuraminate synthase family protein [Bacillota bacterium]
MCRKDDRPLFIFEMANNHGGNLEHGIQIIREIHKVCQGYDFKFAFKFQYRDLDTFIHPSYKDSKDIKFVRRFSETRLSKDHYLQLKNEVERLGFLAICTPFDEKSVDLIIEHNYHYIKIASCSFTDWPLLEKIVQYDKPIIASTAGISLEDIDNVVSFFKHRGREIALMHCVAEYPTPNANLQLNQIDLLLRRYPNLRIGYSTHEAPDNFDSIKIAIAKGASIFEKHVGISTGSMPLNAYSATPQQVLSWLKSAREAFEACGVKDTRYMFSEKEKADLVALRRGVFAKTAIKKGEQITGMNVFYAIPNFANQLLANDMSKYKEYTANTDIEANQPVISSVVKTQDTRNKIAAIINQVKELLKEAKIALPNKVSFEISHHYGIDNFLEAGAVIINCINREYCKKIIVLAPGQKHPAHIHKLKEESFQILYGDMSININGVEKEYQPGEIVLVERGASHSFSTKNGAIFEEVSTTHYLNDSYYLDPRINENKRRKTELNFWVE